MRWLVLLAACGGPADVATLGVDMGVRTWVDGASRTGGTVVSQVVAPADVAVDIGQPEGNGLEFSAVGEPTVELVGDLQVVTQTWSYAGESGHYEIRGPAASWEGAQAMPPSPLFVDVGVTAPREGELVDISDPDAIRPWPWVAAGVGAGLLALVGAGVLIAFRRPRAVVEPPPPAHLVALRAWERAWADPDLDDHGRALAISRIFREYAESVLAFPASAWTTTEILRHLAGLAHLTPENHPRAKRLLRATDRVKFADEDATHDLFVELDSDLRAFVASTRPRSFEGAA